MKISIKKWFEYITGQIGISAKSTISQPYEITISNKNETNTSVNIFGSHLNLHRPNYGLPKGVEITSVPHQDKEGFYGYILSRIISNPVEIGMCYLQTIKGSNAVLTSVWTKHVLHPNGSSTTTILQPKKNPMQMQADILEFERTFVLDGDTSIGISIPAYTEFRISFYPSLETKSLLTSLLYCEEHPRDTLPSSFNNIYSKISFSTRSWLKQVKDKLKDLFKKKK